jgi:cytochrome c
MYQSRRMQAERVVSTALDIAAYILEQRHKGKPVHVDRIDHPELKALVAKIVTLSEDKASKALDAALRQTA